MNPRRQRALLDRLEARFAKSWQLEIARAMRASAKEYADNQSIMLAIGKHRANVTQLLRRTYEVSGNEFAKPIYEKALSHGMVKKDFENFLRLIESFIRGVGATRVTQISKTTENQIRQAISEGVSEGLGAAAIASNIRANAPLIAGVRAAVIARTETHSASQWAQVEAIRDTGLVLRKEWVAANDERTRVFHGDANGQIVGPDEKFLVGGEELEFPGDPNGSAENVINCRCVLNFVE